MALTLHRHGRVPPGAIVKLYFGGALEFGLPPTTTALEAYLEMLEPSGLPWSVAVLGGDVVACGLAETAVRRGGHVRVGLEDFAGSSTPTNTELVDGAVALLADLGHRPATHRRDPRDPGSVTAPWSTACGRPAACSPRRRRRCCEAAAGRRSRRWWRGGSPASRWSRCSGGRSSRGCGCASRPGCSCRGGAASSSSAQALAVPGEVVVDACCGSGAIGAALLAARPVARAARHRRRPGGRGLRAGEPARRRGRARRRSPGRPAGRRSPGGST